MNVSDFDFDLPPESIAQRPAPRGTSRLMTLDRSSGAIGHANVADLPSLLLPGDLLVVNDTRVVPARLFGRDADGRRTEFLLVEKTEED
ncbi:MAG TPA: S-adenosylmethionine:tRNA ribosyltransferase-isomerase, partial [Thermoanaerobaculia bacterium]|nr:S-adenosylmethionine:tRNA ribosyltransferase-isomerase [Thermoanaerobaculia bacterium]